MAQYLAIDTQGSTDSVFFFLFENAMLSCERVHLLMCQTLSTKLFASVGKSLPHIFSLCKDNTELPLCHLTKMLSVVLVCHCTTVA